MHTAKGMIRSILVMGIHGTSKFAQYEPTSNHDNPQLKKILGESKKRKVKKLRIAQK
jgi:hypothetical protein